MGWRPGSLLALAAAGAAWLIGAPSAGAAAGFVPAETLPATGSADLGVQTAMAPNGFAIAGWVERVDATHTAIRVATRPPGGPWSPAQQLDPSALTQTRYQLSVAVDSAGDAAIAWDDEQLGAPTVDTAAVATKAAAQSSFGTVQTITGAADPVAGIDSAGHVTMIDNELDGASHDLVDRVWSAGGALPATPSDLVAAGCRSDVTPSALAVAPNGDAIAAAECTGDTFVRRIGGAWKPKTTPVSDSSSAGSCPAFGASASRGQEMAVAIDAAGDVAGAFVEDQSSSDCLSGTTDSYSLSLVIGAGQSVTPVAPPVDTATSFDFAGSSLSGLDVAVAPGTELLAWRNGNLTLGGDLLARFFDRAGNPQGAPQKLVTAQFGSAGIALSPSGAALAVFPTHDNSAVQAATRAPGASSFSAPIALGPAPSQAPSVAIDDGGDGVAVFDAGQSPSAVVQARGFDASPPSIDSASIPATATTGATASFAAQASDLWGPVTLSWDFGDGSAAAAGGSPMHTFTTPGARTVTVTATDAVGNVASRSGTVTVTASTPILSHASIKPKRFKKGHTATFTFTLNEPASIAIAIERQKRTKHHTRRFKRVGTVTASGQSGVNHVRFTGTVGKRKLKPGRYRATITASVGHAKSRPATVGFTILAAG